MAPAASNPGQMPIHPLQPQEGAPSIWDALTNTMPGTQQMGAPALNSLVGAAIPGGAATEGMGLLEGIKNSPLVSAISSLIPSKARAGANLEAIRDALQNKAPDLSQAYNTVQRAKELSLAGHGPISTGMNVLDQAMQPATLDAMGTPITVNPSQIKYPQSFDMASAAKNAASGELQGMTGMMQAQVKQFASALQQGNRQLATENGLGGLFDEAMKEYRQAKTLEDATKIAVNWGKKAAIVSALAGLGGGAAKAGSEIYNRIFP